MVEQAPQPIEHIHPMPGESTPADGAKAYDQMKDINPDVKVLLASGYTLEGQAKEILDSGCNAFIQKPFKIEQLSIMIRKVIDNECD